MGKRKASSDETVLPELAQFIETSWKNIDKKGNYGEFVKTCEVKWAEMSENEKLASIENFDSKKKREGKEKESTARARSKKVNSKDPNRKKKPPGPYIIFCSDTREEIKKSNPDFTASQILQELGKRWKALADSQKSMYQDKAKLEREKYLKELKEEKSD